jgi:hypothetical protein
MCEQVFNLSHGSRLLNGTILVLPTFITDFNLCIGKVDQVAVRKDLDCTFNTDMARNATDRNMVSINKKAITRTGLLT